MTVENNAPRTRPPELEQYKSVLETSRKSKYRTDDSLGIMSSQDFANHSLRKQI